MTSFPIILTENCCQLHRWNIHLGQPLHSKASNRRFGVLPGNLHGRFIRSLYNYVLHDLDLVGIDKHSADGRRCQRRLQHLRQLGRPASDEVETEVRPDLRPGAGDEPVLRTLFAGLHRNLFHFVRRHVLPGLHQLPEKWRYRAFIHNASGEDCGFDGRHLHEYSPHVQSGQLKILK